MLGKPCSCQCHPHMCTRKRESDPQITRIHPYGYTPAIILGVRNVKLGKDCCVTSLDKACCLTLGDNGLSADQAVGPGEAILIGRQSNHKHLKRAHRPLWCHSGWHSRIPPSQNKESPTRHPHHEILLPSPRWSGVVPWSGSCYLPTVPNWSVLSYFRYQSLWWCLPN